MIIKHIVWWLTLWRMINKINLTRHIEQLFSRFLSILARPPRGRSELSQSSWLTRHRRASKCDSEYIIDDFLLSYIFVSNSSLAFIKRLPVSKNSREELTYLSANRFIFDHSKTLKMLAKIVCLLLALNTSVNVSRKLEIGSCMNLILKFLS